MRIYYRRPEAMVTDGQFAWLGDPAFETRKQVGQHGLLVLVARGLVVLGQPQRGVGQGLDRCGDVALVAERRLVDRPLVVVVVLAAEVVDDGRGEPLLEESASGVEGLS
jgi:hypothetical protein